MSVSLFESLESRCLKTAINWAGTSAADTISVDIDSSNPNLVDVTQNGVVTQYSSVRSISVSGGGGNDTITIGNSITIGCAISGNAGSDTIVGGFGNDSITGNAGADSINGSAGDDVEWAVDQTTNSDSAHDTLYYSPASTGYTDTLNYNSTEDSIVQGGI